MGVPVAGGVGVVIDTNGQLATVASSARFEAEIKPIDEASAAIRCIKTGDLPTTRKNLISRPSPQSGLVAKGVLKVNPDLVVCDEEGKPYAVR
ncbi:MAG: hypothetical protein DME59_04045 [Verrucomicrobia bacterium]|nr:MAG: hypothetical protein DME59_04045 [Verrucomicrobiota bacterium]